MRRGEERSREERRGRAEERNMRGRVEERKSRGEVLGPGKTVSRPAQDPHAHAQCGPLPRHWS